jgi:hypothetical protein
VVAKELRRHVIKSSNVYAIQYLEITKTSIYVCAHDQ